MIFTVALAWALFQFWYASPLPFTFGVGILNDTEARSLHLAFALFLAFTAWPAFERSPRDRVPIADWAFALAGAFAGAYLLLFYRELALRPGQPTTMDIVVAVTGHRAAARGNAALGRLADGRARAAVHRLHAWAARTCPTCSRTRARRSRG